MERAVKRHGDTMFCGVGCIDSSSLSSLQLFLAVSCRRASRPWWLLVGEERGSEMREDKESLMEDHSTDENLPTLPHRGSSLCSSCLEEKIGDVEAESLTVARLSLLPLNADVTLLLLCCHGNEMVKKLFSLLLSLLATSVDEISCGVVWC